MIAALTWLLLLSAPPATKGVCPVEGGGPPFIKPIPEAAQLSADGRKAYDRKDFAGAIALFRQAVQRDPGFLSARINLASALARAQRIGEAATEAAAVIDSAYVPGWFRVNEATDLLVLQSLPERKVLDTAGARAAPLWGARVNQGLLLIARTGEGLKSGENDRPGVYVVAPHQEVFSWDPVRGGFHQVTAEEGRVVAMAHDRASARLIYARAEKIVRAQGEAPRWRGVTLRILDLHGMRLSGRIPVPDGLSELSLAMETMRGKTLPVMRARMDGRPMAMQVLPTGLVRHVDPIPRRKKPTLQGERGCRFRAESLTQPAPRIRIIREGGSRFELDTPFGGFLGTAMP